MLIEAIGEVTEAMKRQSEVNLLVATVVQRAAERNNSVDEVVVISMYFVAAAVVQLCVVVDVSLHVGVVDVSPLSHVLALFSLVVKFISPFFNFLRQGATDCVPIKETKSKQ